MTDTETSTSLIIKAEVKRRIKQMEGQTAGDFPDALNQKVETIVKEAVGRAQANGRKQVRGCDL